MKLGLFTVTWEGLFYKGRALSLEEQISKAKEFGFEGVSLNAKRPVASPLDFDKKRRNQIKELAQSLGIDICAVEPMSNFSSPINEEREANLCYVNECIRFANDLDSRIVKVFAAWMGVTLHNGLGTYMFARSRTYPFVTPLDQWNWCVEGIKECAKWAEEYGIIVAIQNHAPVVRTGYEDVLQMVSEIGEDNVKLCLDVPLFHRQDDEYVKEAVQKCKDLIVLSHYSSIDFDETPMGGIVQKPHVYIPGEPLINYRAFFKELNKIGYDGFLTSEECSPVLENHKYQGIEVVDRHVKAALKHMKQLRAQV